MHALTRLLAAGVCAACAASAVLAQTRQVAPRTATAPSASTRAATAAPQPGGLRPIFPAGVNSGSGAAVSSDPVAASTSPIPAGTSTATTTTTTAPGGGRVPSELLPSDTNVGAVTTAPNTAVLGAGATAPGPAQWGAGGAGGFAAVDTARSFLSADANHDGQLTRAEARRLSISTMSFEEMDRNFDGVITRFEYEDSVR